VDVFIVMAWRFAGDLVIPGTTLAFAIGVMAGAVLVLLLAYLAARGQHG